MRRERRNRKPEGAITVFLSLVLLLILSLVMTILESARVNTAKLFADRALRTAMDSVLAEFYDPLFEEYHLLALEAGYGESGINREEMDQRLRDYMSYTFRPNRDLLYHEESLELYDISVDSLKVDKTAGLMDYGGELFLNEAVEYMKYRELGNGMELLLDKMSALKKPEKVSVLFEEKLKAEEELLAIEKGILRLMQLFDGIATSEKGLKVNTEGVLQTVPDYIKKICYGEVTREKAGINNDSIYAAMAGSYADPDSYFTKLDQCFHRLDTIKQRIRSLDASIEESREWINDARITLEEWIEHRDEVKNDKKNKEAYETAKTQVKAYKEYIEELEELLSNQELERTACESKMNAVIYEISVHREDITLLIQNLKTLIPQAEAVIDNILLTSEKADDIIKHYEGSLKSAKEELGEEIYSTMEEGLWELNRYRSDNISGYHFPKMKELLQQDYAIINTTETQLIKAGTALDSRDLGLARECFERAGELLKIYRTEELRLDYSSLVIQKSSDDNPLGLLGELVSEGLTGLVTDASKISEAKLTEGTLPSDLAFLGGETGSGFDFGAFFKSLVIGGKNAGLKGLFGDFGEYDFATTLGGVANMATEHLLFQAYLQEHFYRLPMEGEDTSGRKPSVLAYEQEYLLIGKPSDRENLKTLLSQLIQIRAILNFTSLLGDKVKWKEARTIASGLVGFTGLPILVSITQTILVVLLAFAEALVDTCALLMGKEVAIFKKQVGLSFIELLGLQRDFIRMKAAAYPKEQGALALTYADHLKIFLFLKDKQKLSYRCMDLIQENIKLRYQNSFSLQSCIFGYETEAKFYIKSKFIALGFVKKLTSKNTKGFLYHVKAGYSY